MGAVAVLAVALALVTALLAWPSTAEDPAAGPAPTEAPDQAGPGTSDDLGATDGDLGSVSQPTTPVIAPPTTMTRPTVVATSPPPTRARSTSIPASAITTEASSVLAEANDNGRLLTYGPRNVLDDDPHTAWSQAGTTGATPPEGSWLRLSVDRPADLDAMVVHNGYGKNADVYHENARARRITVTGDDGASRSVELADTGEPQTVHLGWDAVAVLTVRIDSVYHGTERQRYLDRGDQEDVALTEIDLIGRRR